MPAQNTLQNANEHDHVELKTLAIVDPVGMEIDRNWILID
jgi:hypothetical protein